MSEYLNTPHPRLLAYDDGFERGKMEEHRRFHASAQIGVVLLAHARNYTSEEQHRACFIRGYGDGHAGRAHAPICVKCGFFFQEGMSYRTIPETLCYDCWQEDDTAS